MRFYFITFFSYSAVQHPINLNTVIVVWKSVYGKKKGISCTASMFTDLEVLLQALLLSLLGQCLIVLYYSCFAQ